MDDMVSVGEFASKLGIGAERVRQLCRTGRVAGARLLTVGGASVWLIPAQARDPRLRPGRPKKPRARATHDDSAETASMPTFKRIDIDPRESEKRLHEGRREAARIIEAMKRKGVTVELFGSMKTGKVFPASDVDLLVTDCGPLAPAEVLYQIDLLAGHIPVDTTILKYVPKESIARIMESVDG